jgi:hypothetical protein
LDPFAGRCFISVGGVESEWERDCSSDAVRGHVGQAIHASVGSLDLVRPVEPGKYDLYGVEVIRVRRPLLEGEWYRDSHGSD